MKNTIVIVDDNEDLRETFADLFIDTDVKAVCFSNVLDAKIYLKNSKNLSEVKAIVSDLMMAPTDGLDFLSYIKAKPELSQIDFYLMTGAAVTVFEPFLRPFTIKGIITKPFDVRTILSIFTKPDQQAPRNVA